MKYLSVNTDDFGLSKDIDRGIAEAYKKGVLTDASLMANGPNYEKAIALTKEYKIPIAAHVNLIRGKMITDFTPPASIINFWKKSLDNNYLLKIEKEARAQIEKILKDDIRINQINSEKHSHFFPPIFRLWLKLAEEYEIPYIRFIKEFNITPSIQGIKANLLSFFSIINKKYLNDSPIKSTNYFKGILITGKLNFNLLVKTLKKFKNGWTELMVHIGYEGEIDKSMGNYFLNKSREEELKALFNPRFKDIISTLGIKLKSFGGEND